MFKLIYCINSYFSFTCWTKGNVLTFLSGNPHYIIGWYCQTCFSQSVSVIWPDKTFGGLWITVHCSVTVFNIQFCFMNTHLTLPCLLWNAFYEIVYLQNIYNPVESCLLFRCIKSRTFQTGCLSLPASFYVASYLLSVEGSWDQGTVAMVTKIWHCQLHCGSQ